MLPYNQGERMLEHTKMLPECRNVTKQNCVTLWETDPDGKQVRSLNLVTGKLFQVWAGTDACEPVTWQECKLVPKEVKFIVPEMNCLEKQELWYHEPEKVEMEWGAIVLLLQVTETKATNVFSCSVETSVACSVKPRSSCKEITWSECR